MDEPQSSGARGETSGKRSDRPSSECPNTDRRRVLVTVGSMGSVFLTGCLDGEPEPDEEVESYVVTFVDGEYEVGVTVAENERLMYPALNAGVEIPYSCEVGRCGECTAKYDGDANEIVIHDGNRYLDEDQIADGWVLTCVAYPRSDSELEVTHPDDV